MKNYNDKNEKYYVYGLFDDEGLFYIGKGSKNRYEHHFKDRNLKKESVKNQRIIKYKKKYNKWPPVEILKSNMTAKDAFNYEKQLILEHGRLDTGTGILTNQTNGGGREKGWKMPQHIKDKISKSKLGKNRKVTWGKKISEGKIGKKHSPDHRKKLSNINSKRCKGKTVEEIYGEERGKEIKEKSSKNMMKKGMTWEERYGVEKAAELRAKRYKTKGMKWKVVDGKRVWYKPE